MQKKKIPSKLISMSFLGELDSQGKKDLDQWLEDPENHKIYESLKKFHSQSCEKLSSYNPDGNYLWHRLQMETARHKPSAFRGYIVAAVSAAAVVLLIVSTTLHFVRNSSSLEDALVSVESVSGKSKAVLPDGTVVWLNGKSAIGYDKKSFGRRERLVNLKGEAFFEVEKDTEKPFRVNSGGLTVTVTGTKFNVEETDSTVNVSLKEGSVDLSVADGQVLSMKAGQKAGYNRASGRLAMLEGEVASDICWAQESLVFNGSSLGNVCGYLSSWYGVEISVDPRVKDNFAYTFTVVDESLVEIFRIMAEINPIKYEKLKDGSWYLTTLSE